ncbi:hypothetical protein AAIH46_02280 [Rhizobium sp. 0TCS1.26]|uniref:DUF6894 family protein n=1 Tax=Rhizobium sp. 0TCS1.26 TaxID=3142623 RepID=UPI003D298D50
MKQVAARAALTIPHPKGCESGPDGLLQSRIPGTNSPPNDFIVFSQGDGMTRYHFNLRSDDGWTSDVVAVDLASPVDVLVEAGRLLSDVARDELPGRDRLLVFLEVLDAEGCPIFVSSLSFVAEWLGNSSSGGDGTD